MKEVGGCLDNPRPTLTEKIFLGGKGPPTPVGGSDGRCSPSRNLKSEPVKPRGPNPDQWTPAAARSKTLLLEPGRSPRCGLFARRAGVHVDFHAYRHFDNLRSFPGHTFLPGLRRDVAPTRRLRPPRI